MRVKEFENGQINTRNEEHVDVNSDNSELERLERIDNMSYSEFVDGDELWMKVT